MKKKELSIELFSDFICPWCYLAHCRLDRMQRDPLIPFKLRIQFKPFLLYPSLPSEGLAKEELKTIRKPGMSKALKEEAQIENIQIQYRKIDTIPNSLEAHRFTSLLSGEKIKAKYALLIFKAYFEEGINIGIRERMVSLVEKNDIKSETLRRFLETDNGLDQVSKMIQHSAELGITTVPSIRIEKAITLPGLQSYNLYLRYFSRSLKLIS